MDATDETDPIGLYRWNDPPLIGVAVVMAVVGFAQFSPTAALADVAAHFGQLRDGDTIAEQAGLPGTVLGAGLAVIRLATLAALPLAAVADRVGRRRTFLAWVSLGLVAVLLASGSPGYWWFVAAFAVARPLLSASDTLGKILAAEHTPAADRAKALALMSGAYAVGAGAVAILRALAADAGFRLVFAISGLLLLAVALAGRSITEPARFDAGEAGARPVPVLSAVRGGGRGRLAALAGLAFGSGLVTGPGNTFLFVYAENVLDVSTTVTGSLVLAAGVAGLAGLLLGRSLSDRIGRRPTGAAALVGLCACSVTAYTGSVGALWVGYLGAIFAGAIYITPALALATELFPTSARASVAGWLVAAGVAGSTSGLLVAGVVADASGSFAVAIACVAAPAALAAALVAPLPETRGMELEESSRR